MSLKDVLGNLTFDARLTDPKKKVGKVFQYVDKVILLNGIDGVFPVKEIASHIVIRRCHYDPLVVAHSGRLVHCSSSSSSSI